MQGLAADSEFMNSWRTPKSFKKVFNAVSKDLESIWAESSDAYPALVPTLEDSYKARRRK
jgi:hypothetical protein